MCLFSPLQERHCFDQMTVDQKFLKNDDIVFFVFQDEGKYLYILSFFCLYLVLIDHYHV